jgi:hypothetical protein
VRDLQRDGRLPGKGFVKREEPPLVDFLEHHLEEHYR